MKPDFLKKKKNWWPEFGPNGSKLLPKLVFFNNFLKFCSLVFLEIAYNDSLQECVTSSTHKIVRGQISTKTVQNQAQNYLAIFSSLFL